MVRSKAAKAKRAFLAGFQSKLPDAVEDLERLMAKYRDQDDYYASGVKLAVYKKLSASDSLEARLCLI